MSLPMQLDRATLNTVLVHVITLESGLHIARTKFVDSTETGRTVSVRPSRYSLVMEAS